MMRTAAMQAAIQPWSIVILPIAFLIMHPFPKAFAFFQNASLMGSGDESDLRSVVQKSWRQASLWTVQNTLIIWLTSPLLQGLAAFLLFVIVPVPSSFNPGAPVPFLLIVAALVGIPLCPLGMVTALIIGMAVLLFPWLLKTLAGGAGRFIDVVDVAEIFGMPDGDRH